MARVKIIAEIGVNHNGSIELARQMVAAAHAAGADAVKFQTFSAANLAKPNTPKVPYQKRHSDPRESHYEMLKALELPAAAHRELMDYCNNTGIEFCSTPYSREDAEFLHELGVPFYKVASANITDLPLHEFLCGTGKPCILATGMATLGEIEETLSVYDKTDSRKQVTLLQCVSAYPADPADVNLRAMVALRDAFKVKVGYSDHTRTPYAAIAAVALGAEVVEKHFTLDKNLPGPDHEASMSPEELRVLVEGVRTAEAALGDGIKRICASETAMREISRKSVVVARGMRAGEVVTREDLAFQRPGDGLSPMHYPQLIGRKLRRPLVLGAAIRLDDVA